MLLEAMVRNVRRTFREVNAFDVKGDDHPAAHAAFNQDLETAVEGGASALPSNWMRPLPGFIGAR